MTDLLDLLERSRTLGFLGPMPIVEQVDHADGFVSAIESSLGHPPGSLVDLGSGGGVPGLVIAQRWPETSVVLLDSNERRTDFLREATDQLGLEDRVEVVHLRAETFGRDDVNRERFAAVTARSFAPPAVTAECGAPLLEPGGLLVVSEPPQAVTELRWSADGLAVVGLEVEGSVRPTGPYGYQRLRKTSRTPARYPRKVGVPNKRPIF